MAAHFDLPDIKLFVNIAEANSLTRGAERSHMSLPAASIRIKNLEEGLGVKLLYRTSQGVTLTPPGQAFMHHARLVLQQLSDLRADLSEYVKGTRGHVRIFANTTAMAEFLPALLQKFLATHPDVNVDLKERLSHDIVRAVAEGKVDVGIVAGNVRTDGLETLALSEDRLVLVTSETHVLANRGRIDFSEALTHDFVGMVEASAIHSFLAQAANDLNRPIKIRIQVGNFEAACRMIESGVGIGVVPFSSASRHAKTMNICMVELTDEWAIRKMQVCVRNVQALPAFARELVELLVAKTPLIA
ncbi:MAG: LysR substrate-binding domain-containing protein [Oxalobacteraceae bacterium]|jgi:DNA-binding transcriptional LysR family regulator|nr:LysR substrate-binding domain-containing protein [Oxalobacteraceae bacterium]